jgi:hypothetical protein
MHNLREAVHNSNGGLISTNHQVVLGHAFKYHIRKKYLSIEHLDQEIIFILCLKKAARIQIPLRTG